MGCAQLLRPVVTMEDAATTCEPTKSRNSLGGEWQADDEDRI